MLWFTKPGRSAGYLKHVVHEDYGLTVRLLHVSPRGLDQCSPILPYAHSELELYLASLSVLVYYTFTMYLSRSRALIGTQLHSGQSPWTVP